MGSNPGYVPFKIFSNLNKECFFIKYFNPLCGGSLSYVELESEMHMFEDLFAE